MVEMHINDFPYIEKPNFIESFKRKIYFLLILIIFCILFCRVDETITVEGEIRPVEHNYV